MSLRAYSEINLHVTWHVRDNASILTGFVEAQTHRFLRSRAVNEPGVNMFEVGGTDDHIHLAVSVPPSLLISEWVGRLKGASSHYVNHEVVNRKVLAWQAGYGVVTFGTRDLPWVVDYIRNQRHHHADGRIHERLERTEAVDKTDRDEQAR